MDDLDFDDVIGFVLEVVGDIIFYSNWGSNKRTRYKKKKKDIKQNTQKRIQDKQVKSTVSGAENQISKQISSHMNSDTFKKVMKADSKQNYITALIGTSVALSYADDGRLDRHEKRMIKELIKRYKYDLNKETRKNIRYVKRGKMNQVRLLKLYKRLNIDEHSVSKIISDLQSLLVYGNKDVTKQKEFLTELRKQISEEQAA